MNEFTSKFRLSRISSIDSLTFRYLKVKGAESIAILGFYVFSLILQNVVKVHLRHKIYDARGTKNIEYWGECVRMWRSPCY